MKPLDRALRAVGIGFLGDLLIWLVALSIIFITEDAGHQKAHLTQTPRQVAWIGFVIGVSIAWMIAVLILAYVRGDAP